MFSTKHVSVVEKRILMKFLTKCLNLVLDPDNKSKNQPEGEQAPPPPLNFDAFPTYKDYLVSEKLTPNLIHFVLKSIAMVTEETGCTEGLKATQKFLGSLGRFGNTPFLWSMYGSGEMPQAFCR